MRTPKWLIPAALVLLPLAVLLILRGVYESELSSPLRLPAGLGASASESGGDSAGGPAEAILRTRAFRVRPREGFGTIAGRLRREGWIRHAWPVRMEAKRRRWDRTVAPGWYAWKPGESVRDFIRRLGRGQIEETKLTIPEGWRLGRILSTVADSAWVSLDSIRAAGADSAWLAGEEVPGPGLEGYLFPDTYLIPKGQSPRRILTELLHRGITLWRDSLEAPAKALGLGRRQLWTLASLVEAEAESPEERPRIAAVFWNRLRSGMKLECDPTVLYALERPPGRVFYKDLEIDSPYNTYREIGLPPGPICSPGRASLWAAVHPEPGCQSLFFVARGDGHHVFSRSLEEHDRARLALRR